MSGRFSKCIKITLITIVAIIILILFSEIYGNYNPPNSYVLNETRERVANYPFGKNLFFDEYVIRYPLNVSVVSFGNGKVPLGISTDTDKLDFGILPLNFSERKKINIRNPTNKNVELRMYSFGNITKLLKYTKRIVVAPRQTKEITIKLNATEIGNYTGELDVLIRYPKNKLFEGLIKWI